MSKTERNGRGWFKLSGRRVYSNYMWDYNLGDFAQGMRLMKTEKVFQQVP